MKTVKRTTLGNESTHARTTVERTSLGNNQDDMHRHIQDDDLRKQSSGHAWTQKRGQRWNHQADMYGYSLRGNSWKQSRGHSALPPHLNPTTVGLRRALDLTIHSNDLMKFFSRTGSCKKNARLIRRCGKLTDDPFPPKVQCCGI